MPLIALIHLKKMGNIYCSQSQGDPDSEWKRQNQEARACPMYKYSDYDKSLLVEAYKNGGRKEVVKMARNEIKPYLYNHGDGKLVTKAEYLTYQRQLLKTQTSNSEIVNYVPNYSTLGGSGDSDAGRWVCWDLERRGGVGETAFLLLFLMNTPLHTKVAKILLKEFPCLAMDIYEGKEYYGESALHIAIVYGNMKGVRVLVNKGADVYQRASGSFFLPKVVKTSTKSTNQGLTYYGEYPLAFAAVFGHKDIYDFLIRRGADPDARDSFGNTVLHMTVITNQQEMFRYAVKHETKPANMHIKNDNGLTPLALASKLGRAMIFEEMLELGSVVKWQFSNNKCSLYPLSALDTIGPEGDTELNSALMYIVNGETDQHLNMLEGDVIHELLTQKWDNYAKRRFKQHLLLAFFHLIMLSVAIYLRPSDVLFRYTSYIDPIRYIAEVIVLIGCVVSISMQVFEVNTQGPMVFIKNCRHAPARTIFLLSCILILACVPVRLLSLVSSQEVFHSIEDGLLIIATPGSWCFLLFFARGVKLTGPFVTMIFKMIAGDLFRFATIFVIFLLGFMQAFFFLFRDIPNAGITSFLTLPGTIMTLFQMTFGEFKYDEFGYTRYAVVTKIVFALFMILVPILLLNMLIAMMGNTYQQVISKSEKEWKKQWAQIVVVLERSYSRAQLKKFMMAYSVEIQSGTNKRGDYTEKNDKNALQALTVVKAMQKRMAEVRKEAIINWKCIKMVKCLGSECKDGKDS